eukprot:Blabericola_migrator_1__9388@NODE_506_length_7963_cov_38_720618_g388_i0_p3_GENE_NODE_506_length_7963_cov_38_720618_g388_i0NODE_506_length_7963_cov_38_720618_g388_i0_p3_ORF_typecomplete_len413_score83_79ADH_N/PF08240_12/1_1e29ADH_zinc_N/PF00107_26/1e04ADH_zinc_N/PF00107_26/2_3e22Glu_dehyd_C/PF16912_5/1_4e15AlaDh_PNT_C/PF01262_21/8_5e08AlaDh_PNT_C/PF01262_21/4e032Hacid_dh_C/PF02826_19/2e06AdoHcyase_NAD/PF00670_21/0_00073Shikimate_DH/PF01488_20/0_0027CMAS/PF02353_20/0_01NAD_binding_2/PF03446_15/0_0
MQSADKMITPQKLDTDGNHRFGPREVNALAAKSAGGPIESHTLKLRELGPYDVEIEVLYCGLCHTDVHYIGNDWDSTHFPVVPGHEVVGDVRAVGSEVSRVKQGDRVGVGYIVGSCQNCEECKTGRENYCDHIITTMSGVMPNGEITQGGWAKRMVAPEQFIIHIPKNLDPAAAAPLLCAGVTVFSPMKHWKMANSSVGIVGLGGLGHLAVMFAKAMGCTVTAIDIKDEKAELAKKLGADKYINALKPEQMESGVQTLNFIIDTAPSPKAIEPFLELLKTDGTIINIGLPTKEFKIQIPPASLSFKRRGIHGTLTGSVADAQDMFDFAGKHNITAWVEVISADELKIALNRMIKGDVKFRFVIDIKNTLHGEHQPAHADHTLCVGAEPVHTNSRQRNAIANALASPAVPSRS